MKRIRRTNRFKRLYKERIALDERLKQDFIASLHAFREDRTWVDDHPLENVMEGQRAFSINEAYRVVYVETQAMSIFFWMSAPTSRSIDVRSPAIPPPTPPARRQFGLVSASAHIPCLGAVTVSILAHSPHR